MDNRDRILDMLAENASPEDIALHLVDEENTKEPFEETYELEMAYEQHMATARRILEEVGGR